VHVCRSLDRGAAAAARRQRIGSAGAFGWPGWASGAYSAGRTGLGLVSFVAIAVIGPFAAPDSPEALLTFPFGKPSGRFLLGGDFPRPRMSCPGSGRWLACCC